MQNMDHETVIPAETEERAASAAVRSAEGSLKGEERRRKRREENRTVWCTYTLVCLGALVALSLILTRALSIPIGGFGRLALGPVATILAGLWFGPAGGALCGLSADLLGCLMQGYAPNPFITAAAVMWGVLPALLRPSASWKKPAKIVSLFAGILLTACVSSLLLTTTGLVVMYGYSLPAILPTRLTQFSFMAPAYGILVSILYFSPVTGMIRGAVSARSARRTAEAR